jgi:hypothetical protein
LARTATQRQRWRCVAVLANHIARHDDAGDCARADRFANRRLIQPAVLPVQIRQQKNRPLIQRIGQIGNGDRLPQRLDGIADGKVRHRTRAKRQ